MITGFTAKVTARFRDSCILSLVRTESMAPKVVNTQKIAINTAAND
ncbi:hypothetical protein JCM19232_3131 [Vibrio ishigakensis]|uniref:Uncharacterized protein n=1 Tax=Vibrio ishigakensis TaxID=1481914 RepID=A0A0B8PNV4_9VIBR|nr:hypothetical protein JCM19232_3131 [Vibrio ishigakensis]